MGLVCNNGYNSGIYMKKKKHYFPQYKSGASCRESISRHRRNKALTRQNIKFLKSLGLKVTSGGN